MHYLRTIPAPAGAPAAPPRRWGNRKPAAPAQAEEQAERGTLTFLLLMVFTALLFGRPNDFFFSLRFFPFAQIAAVLAISAYAVALLTGELRFQFPRELKIVFGITFFFLAGIPTAFWRSRSYETLTDDWLKTVIIFYLITQTMFTVGRVRKMITVIIVCMFVVSLYQTLNPDASRMVQGRLRGVTVGFLSGNYLGIAVGAFLPFMAVLLLRSKSWLFSAMLLITMALTMRQVMQTASRGSLLQVLFSVVLIWVFLLKESRKAKMLGVGFGILILGAILSAPGIFWTRISTLWTPDSVTEGSLGASAAESEFQRKALFWRSIQYTFENPVLGLGVGNFPIKSGSTTRNAQEWKGTHNTFTQISSEAGIPAFLLFIWLISICARNMRHIGRVLKDRPEFEELRLLSLATLISIMIFVFAGFFAHLAYDYYFYYLAGTAVALQCAFVAATKGLDLTPKPAPAIAGGNGRRGFVR